MIDGFAIGHHQADADGWLTGTTVIFAPDGAVGGVDVRGGGPGTRETDLLDPTTTVERVNAVVLTGGSAYGLAAADGVMTALEERSVGFPVGPEPEQVVPIVPAAVIFDLGRGGVFGNRPGTAFGRQALDAARPADPPQGCVGAGTGAVCGGIKGGFGYAETSLSDGVSVGAAVVVNGAGSPIDPRTGRLWADRSARLVAPNPEQLASLRTATAPPALNTTIGVIITDAVISKAHATRLAMVGHDGMARAVAPVHSMLDGDSVFALASLRRPGPADPRAAIGSFNALLEAGAEMFTDACLNALLAAESRGAFPSYTSVVPQP